MCQENESIFIYSRETRITMKRKGGEGGRGRREKGGRVDLREKRVLGEGWGGEEGGVTVIRM